MYAGSVPLAASSGRAGALGSPNPALPQEAHKVAEILAPGPFLALVCT